MPSLSLSFAVMLALAILLSACGGSGDDDAGQAEAENSNRSSGSTEDDSSDSDDSADSDDTVLGPETKAVEPEIRADGLELAFVDGALGPARLGSTIVEITAALGPAYTVTPEPSIRVDFPAGYSISREGEVLFFAIEEDGIITIFMTQHPRVGLDSGLKPGTGLDDAIALHGEPTFTFGPEGREFASFADGTGAGGAGGGGDGTVSVLVAIGQFGGPVGIYETLTELAETTEYQLEDANIKELWFWAS
jgi:hypothetical protein